MNLSKSMSAVAFVFALSAGTGWAAPITVDGDLNDWLQAPTGSAADWTRFLPTVTPNNEHEDSSGGLGTYLNPGYGGQAYDAEAMYLRVEGSMLYVAVVTGLAPNNSQWKPGDLAIDFNNDQTYEYAIVTVGDAVSSGPDTWKAGIGSAGDVYDVSTWNLGLWGAPNVVNYGAPTTYQVQHPTSVAAGDLIGGAQVAYTPAQYNGSPIAAIGNQGGQHYVIEAAVNLNLFQEFTSGSAKFLTVHWTMGCANDWIAVDPALTVPEPATGALFGIGLLGFLSMRRRIAGETAALAV